MEEYDVIVIGSGAGLAIANYSLNHGLKTALVEGTFLGGTCLNVGCTPSKMIIHPADVITEIEEAKELGIHTEIQKIDFKHIIEKTKKFVEESSNGILEAVKATPSLGYYPHMAKFVDDYTLEVGKEKIRGKNIFIAAGARPLIPKIKGISEIDYLTNNNMLNLKSAPKSMIIVGGGYIAVEYGHFFSAMGTKVTLLHRRSRLVHNEEPEISELLLEKLSERMEIFTEMEAVETTKTGDGVKVIAIDKKNNSKREFTAEKLLLAGGRTPNSDTLSLEKTGVEVDEKGFIKVDDFFQTTKPNIWAFGDIIGRLQFRHIANEEAPVVWHNATHPKEKIIFDYSSAPHAIFTRPQIASAGLTEKKAREKHKVLVGKAYYNSNTFGIAMNEKKSFVKLIVEKGTGKILGVHIIGANASILIHEVVEAMANKGNIRNITRTTHIHPALSEVVFDAIQNLNEEGDKKIN